VFHVELHSYLTTEKPFYYEDFGLAALRKIHNPFAVMHRYLPSALIIGLLILFRVVSGMLPETQPNFQPLAALFFCGALVAPGWRGFAIPFGIWAITYPFAIGPVTEMSIFLTTLSALTATYFIGKALSSRGIIALLFGSFVSAIAFHLITNGIAWLGDPMYAKTFEGFWQSVWTGPAGSKIPSWLFLRNFAAANLLFTGLFICVRLGVPKLSLPSHELILDK
jgi:hypothetical protein